MQSQKNLALEGLRGLACMNVVFGHFLFTFFHTFPITFDRIRSPSHGMRSKKS